MKAEDVTISDVMEIFRNYLENSKAYEVVNTKNNGFVLITDPSYDHDGKDLIAERIPDAEFLARALLTFELGDYALCFNPSGKELWQCNVETRRQIWECIRPRVVRLPKEWWDEIEDLFDDYFIMPTDL